MGAELATHKRAAFSGGVTRTRVRMLDGFYDARTHAHRAAVMLERVMPYAGRQRG